MRKIISNYSCVFLVTGFVDVTGCCCCCFVRNYAQQQYNEWEI